MATGYERIHIGLVKKSTGEVIRCSRVKYTPDFDFLKSYILGFATQGYNADDIEIIEFDNNDEVIHYSDSMGAWADNDRDPATNQSRNLPRETDSKYLNGQRKVWMKRDRANNKIEWNENDEVLYPFLVEPQEIKQEIINSLPAQGQAKSKTFAPDNRGMPAFGNDKKPVLTD